MNQRNVTEAAREKAPAKARTRAEKIRSLDIGDEEALLGFGGREYPPTEHDGPETAAALEIPLFVGQGDRDYRVTPEEDPPVWKEALCGSDVRFELYGGLNHVFQDGAGPSTGTAYFDTGAVFDRRVVEDITTFVERYSPRCGSHLPR